MYSTAFVDDYYGYDGAADGDEEDYEGADSEEEG
jgi:hypothetical protein